MKIKKCRVLPFLTVIGLLLFLSGCVAFQVVGAIEKGRMALMYRDPNEALAHFQRAAELDPNVTYSLLHEGVWTYVGRAYYTMGKLPEAQKALARARSLYKEDHLAKLYLGLVFARDGDRPKGLREIEAGLRGLQHWFDNLFRTHPEEYSFWDPGGELEREIKRILAMIEGRDINWDELIARGEGLGLEFEEEIDLVQRDQIEEDFEGDDDDGKAN